MTPHEKIAAVYAKLHADRELHIEQARRARDMQAELADIKDSMAKFKKVIEADDDLFNRLQAAFFGN